MKCIKFLYTIHVKTTIQKTQFKCQPKQQTMKMRIEIVILKTNS